VHRDVKPSNILVRSIDDVKLLDFGIAKLLDQDVDPGVTGTQVAPMTLEAVSPEQVRKETITVATDIYQFGVLAFRLLTGQLPYMADPANTLNWLRAVTEAEPMTLREALYRPQVEAAWSCQTDLARARRQASQDLDAILRKAMAKEPSARYRTMDAMIDDLQRFLEMRPVRARRASAFYKAISFVRRHALSSAAIFVVLAIIGAAANRVRIEHDNAVEAERRQRSLAEAGNDITQVFIQALASSRSEQNGESIDANLLLDNFSNRIEGEALASPEERAALLSLAANILEASGRWQQSKHLYEEQVALRRSASPPVPVLLIQSLTQLAVAQSQADDYKAADATLGEAQKLFDSQPATTSVDQFHATRLLGATLVTMGHYRQSQSYLTRGRELSSAVYGVDSREYAWALWDEARGMAHWRRLDLSLPMYEQALEKMTESFGPQHVNVWGARIAMGVLLANMGNTERAEKLCLDAQAKAKESGGPGEYAASDTLECMSIVRETQGRLVDAIDAERGAVSSVKALEGEGAPCLPVSVARLGHLLAEWEATAQAEPLLRASVLDEERIFNANHPKLADSRLWLALFLMQSNRYEEAALQAAKAQAAYDLSLGSGSAYSAIALAMQASQHAHLNQRDEAEKALAQLSRLAFAGKSVAQIERQRFVRDAEAVLAEKYGKPEMAVRAREQAIEELQVFYGDDHVRVALARLQLAQTLTRTGRWKEARDVARAASPILAANLAPQSPSRAANDALIAMNSPPVQY
jgi:tetratricopeptide (TPR) repeat protein